MKKLYVSDVCPSIVAGDTILMMGVSVLSFGIGFRVYGDFSHSMPAVEGGLLLDMKWPRPEMTDPDLVVAKRIVHLRPKAKLSLRAAKDFSDKAHELALSGRYDLMSFIGGLLGTGAQDAKRHNCAEATLSCYHAAGLLLDRTQRKITPQSFRDFAYGGFFRVIADERVKR